MNVNRLILKLVIVIIFLSLYVDTQDDDIMPCTGVDYIQANIVNLLIFGSYIINIRKELKAGTEVIIGLSEKALFSVDEKLANLTQIGDNEYKMILLKPTDNFRATVAKDPKAKIWLTGVTSVKIDGVEHCELPTIKPTDGLRAVEDEKNLKKPEKNENECGRRKVNHNQLIVYGGITKPGDWPWHVALNSIRGSTFKYICGGTLISETFVLTAAHCVTRHGIAVVPESLGVGLGKHSLIGGDKDPQERQVFKVIVHEEFKHKNLDNDIALLKLSTPAIYNDYIQPACLWFNMDSERLPTENITGAVVGWGFDQSDTLSPDLRFANMPLVPDITCIKRKPLFYSNFLNGKKFCAGVLNGTSACNGDSGGGFTVFVSDSDVTPHSDASASEGVWFVRGIVSVAFSRQTDSICDPNEYVLFTDVNEYKHWILDHIK